MPTEKSPYIYDLRVIQRNLERGLITQKEYEKLLADLEDRKDNVAEPEGEE
jgi:hypothetical protein